MCKFFSLKGAALGTSLIFSAFALMNYDKNIAIKLLMLGFLILSFDVGYQVRNNEDAEKPFDKVLRI